MELRESFIVATEALAINKVRSFLTMLGVIIGVAAVILLVSLGEGAREYVTNEIAGLGSNLLLVTPGKVSTKGGFHPPSAGTTRKLTYDDAQALKRRSTSINEAVPIVLGTGKIKFQNQHRDTTVIGTTPEFEKVRNLHVEVGSYISQEDVDARRHVVILGRKVKLELFGEDNPLGKMVVINDTKYRVVGIMERKGMTLGWDVDDVIFIPVKSAMELFDNDRLFEIIVEAASTSELDRATEDIKSILIRRHSNKEDFTITSQAAMVSTLQSILNVLTGVLGGIAGISLVVGGIGIMNIMLVSVRERTREIGIRKAIGARKRDILAQFLVEAVTLSVVGGVIGILVGASGALAISFVFTYIPTKVSLWSIFLAFTFSICVGIFFGVYPARKASLLDPIEALRYE